MKKSTLEGVKYQAVHRLAVGCNYRGCCQVLEGNIQLKGIGSWVSNSSPCIVSWPGMLWASTETMENTMESSVPHPRAGSTFFLENICPICSQPFQWWRSHTRVQDSLFLDLATFSLEKFSQALIWISFAFLSCFSLLDKEINLFAGSLQLHFWFWRWLLDLPPDFSSPNNPISFNCPSRLRASGDSHRFPLRSFHCSMFPLNFMAGNYTEHSHLFFSENCRKIN